MRARIAFRALISGGSLPGLARRAAALGAPRVRGERLRRSRSAASTRRASFWIVLAVATVLAVLALWRHWRWAFVALAAAALVPRGAGRARAARLGGRLVGVRRRRAGRRRDPGAGRRRRRGLRGDRRAAAAGPPARGRPRRVRARHRRRRRVADGRRAPRRRRDRRRRRRRRHGRWPSSATRSTRLHGVAAVRPAGAGPRLRRAGVWSSEWTPDDPLFDEFEPTGLAFAGDTAYASLGAHRPAGLGHARRRAPDARRPPAASAGSRRSRTGAEEVDGLRRRPDRGRSRRQRLHPAGRLRRPLARRASSPRWRPASARRATSPPTPAAPSTSPTPATAACTASTPTAASARSSAPRPSGAACGDGLDDPLALDPRRCTAVKALAVDRDGNLYMALQNVAMIVG